VSPAGHADLGFRESAARHFAFLERHGFRRSPADDTENPVGRSIAYVGSNVGVRVSFDGRDRCVSVRVTGVREGRLAEAPPDGSSRDLLLELVERHGYRGAGAAGASEPVVDEASRERVLAAWADFVSREGLVVLDPWTRRA